MLNRIIAGGPMPKSLDELADMISTAAVEGGLMDVAIGAMTHKAPTAGHDGRTTTGGDDATTTRRDP